MFRLLFILIIILGQSSCIQNELDRYMKETYLYPTIEYEKKIDHCFNEVYNAIMEAKKNKPLELYSKVTKTRYANCELSPGDFVNIEKLQNNRFEIKYAILSTLYNKVQSFNFICLDNFNASNLTIAMFGPDICQDSNNNSFVLIQDSGQLSVKVREILTGKYSFNPNIKNYKKYDYSWLKELYDKIESLVGKYDITLIKFGQIITKLHHNYSRCECSYN